MEWLDGKVNGSPSTVLALIDSLPEDATFVSYMSAQRKKDAKEAGESGEEIEEIIEEDPERKALADEHTWASHDRRMFAQLLNLIVTLIKISGNWDEKNMPEFPKFGPDEWFKEAEEKKDKPKNIEDVMGMFGLR